MDPSVASVKEYEQAVNWSPYPRKVERINKEKKKKLVVLETWLTATWALLEGFAELCLHLNIGSNKGGRPNVLSADSMAAFFEVY